MFLPGLSSAGVKHVPTMLGLAYLHFVPIVSMAMVHVQGSEDNICGVGFLSALRRSPEIEWRFRLAWKVPLSIEPFCWPILFTF